jgi:hypothetical protein
MTFIAELLLAGVVGGGLVVLALWLWEKLNKW